MLCDVEKLNPLLLFTAVYVIYCCLQLYFLQPMRSCFLKCLDVFSWKIFNIQFVFYRLITRSLLNVSLLSWNLSVSLYFHFTANSPCQFSVLGEVYHSVTFQFAVFVSIIPPTSLAQPSRISGSFIQIFVSYCSPLIMSI